jgi:Protein of unknown function with HXXEE motif
MWNWLVRDWQWPGAALFAAVFLILLIPVIASQGDLALALVFAQLPIYMLHQGEEHIGDRFRNYVNRIVGRGREVLSPTATFWINALGVWGVDLTALYLAWGIDRSVGLAAGYLTVVNACLHIVQGGLRREYNPGLVTAILLFLPAGGWCVAHVGREAGLVSHLIGIAVALGVHVAVVIPVVRHAKSLPTTGS